MKALDGLSALQQLAVVDSDHGNVLLLDGHQTGSRLEFIGAHQRATAVLVDRISMADTGTGWVYRIETAPGYGEDWRERLELRYTPRDPA